MLEYPVELQKMERPDFSLDLGARKVGIEITEAIPQDLAKASALKDKYSSTGIMDYSFFRWDSPPKSEEEMRDIIFAGQLTGPGWEGDSPEIELSKAVREIAHSKTKKLTSNGFDRFDEDWLVIYNNLHSPNDICDSFPYILAALEDYWSPKSFTKVFIQDDQSLSVFSRNDHNGLLLNIGRIA